MGARPIKESLRRRDPERWKDLDEPATYAVGKDFTRAIERWEIEYGRDAGAPTGRSLQPHMRLAHSNLYWTGAGRAVPRVRFLLPISVKGGRLESRSRSGRPRGRSAKPEARLLADARRELRRAWERGNNDQTGQ
jgi:hypothetical protein